MDWVGCFSEDVSNGFVLKTRKKKEISHFIVYFNFAKELSITIKPLYTFYLAFIIVNLFVNSVVGLIVFKYWVDYSFFILTPSFFIVSFVFFYFKNKELNDTIKLFEKQLVAD